MGLYFACTGVFSLIVTLWEFMFEEGDMLTEVLNAEDIKYIRSKYEGNSLGCAENIVRYLKSMGILAAVAFLENDNCFLNSITIKNEFDDKYYQRPFHAVVFLGSCIMDVLNTDRLIASSEYIQQLERFNPKLRLETAYVSEFPNSDGYMIPLTLDFIKNYK